MLCTCKYSDRSYFMTHEQNVSAHVHCIHDCHAHIHHNCPYVALHSCLCLAAHRHTLVMMAAQETLTRALDLQRRRCVCYHRWSDEINALLAGKSTSHDLCGAMEQVIVQELQHISTDLRALQASLRNDESRHASNGNSSSSSDVPSTSSTLPVLHAWIDRLQEVEREHYVSSVKLTQLIVRHGLEPAAESASAAAQSVMTVHDGRHCALVYILPQATRASQRRLLFACCEDVVGWGEEEDAEEHGVDAAGSSGDTDSDVVQDTMEEEQPLSRRRVCVDRDGAVLARYDAARVRQCCRSWSEQALLLWRRKRELEEEAGELVEELQCEISDMAAGRQA